MNLDEILAAWQEDVVIDKSALDDESLKTHKLHSKYKTLYAKDALLLEKMKAALNRLKFEKYEMLTEGLTAEQRAKGWEMPAKGTILKVEAEKYLNVDEDVVKEVFKVSYQQEKVNTLKDIILAINNRSYLINNAIAFMKYMAGG